MVVPRFAASVLVTLVLLARVQLRLPNGNVGRRVTFEDGTTSRVYRETIRRGTATARPVLLVVRFQLRLIGTRPRWHALFRAESIANTPLFAGFPGFRSKLWLTDERTGVYRGVYEWDGAEQAITYATTLTALLRLISVPGSVAYHVVPDVPRDDALRDPTLLGGVDDDPSDRWWRPRAGAA